jgi:hypothetical protein
LYQSISEYPCTDKGASNGESCGHDGGRSGSAELPLERLCWVTVRSILDLTIVEISVVTEGISISVLGIAFDLVVGLLERLESECHPID